MRRKDFLIDILSLKNGEHEYRFDVDDTFFGFFENSPVEKGSLSADVRVEKNERLLRAIFEITGNVDLICDRSLKEFKEDIQFKEEHLFKYSEGDGQDTEEITHIAWNTEQIDLGHLIYEFVNIHIPMKKIHPDHRDDNEEDIVYQTDPKPEKTKEKEGIDPRWEALKKLKNK